MVRIVSFASAASATAPVFALAFPFALALPLALALGLGDRLRLPPPLPPLLSPFFPPERAEFLFASVCEEAQGQDLPCEQEPVCIHL